LVTDPWIFRDIVHQERRPFCGDPANPELSHSDPAIGASALVVPAHAVRSKTSWFFVECPYEDEGHIEMSDDRSRVDAFDHSARRAEAET